MADRFRGDAWLGSGLKGDAFVRIESGTLTAIDGEEFIRIGESPHTLFVKADQSWRSTKAEAQIDAAEKIERIIDALWAQSAKLRQEAAGATPVETH